MYGDNRKDLDEKYKAYLLSDAWRTLARERLEIDGYTCQCCGCRGTAENPLQVHHLSYKHLFNEDVYADLVSLCKLCHKGIHTMMKRTTSPNGKRGWSNSDYVPQVHVFDLGSNPEIGKEGSNE